jgi:hypothetical protein
MAYLAPSVSMARQGSFLRHTPPIHFGDQIRFWVVSVAGTAVGDDHGGYLSVSREAPSGARFSVSPTNQLHTTLDEPCTFTVRHPTHRDLRAPVRYGDLVHLSLDSEPDSVWAPLVTSGLLGPRHRGAASSVEILFRFHAGVEPKDATAPATPLPTLLSADGSAAAPADADAPERALTVEELLESPVMMGARNVLLEAVPVPCGDITALKKTTPAASPSAGAATVGGTPLAELPLRQRFVRAFQPVCASTLGAGLSMDGQGVLLGFGVALPAARVATVTLVHGLSAVDGSLYPQPGNAGDAETGDGKAAAVRRASKATAAAVGTAPSAFGSTAGATAGERRLKRVSVECWDRDFVLARGTVLPASTALVITVPGAGTARIPAAYLPPPPMNLPLLVSGAAEGGFPHFFQKSFPLEAPSAPPPVATADGSVPPPATPTPAPSDDRVVGSITVRWTRVPVAPVEPDFQKLRAKRLAARAAGGKPVAATTAVTAGGKGGKGASSSSSADADGEPTASTASWVAYIIACAAIGACAAAVWDAPEIRALVRRVADVPLSAVRLPAAAAAAAGTVAVPVPDFTAVAHTVAAHFSNEDALLSFILTLSSASLPAVLLVLVALVLNRPGQTRTARAKTPAPLFLLRLSAPVDNDGQPLFEPIDPVPGLITAAAQQELYERQLLAQRAHAEPEATGGASAYGSLDRVPSSGVAPIIASGSTVCAASGCCNSPGGVATAPPRLDRRVSTLLGTSLAPAFEVPSAADYQRLDEPRLMVAQILHGMRDASSKAAAESAAGRYRSGGPDDVKYTVPALNKWLCGEVEIKDYAPALFHRIRGAHGITHEDYERSWTFSAATMPALALGAGRSGSLFLTSADGKYLFKTITKDDMATLRLILADYTEHVCTQPSRLMRFVGLHRFRFAKTGETRHLVVALNIFHVPRPLAEQGLDVSAKFDLKGRKPKKAPELRPTEPNRGVFKDNQVARVFEASPSVRDALIETMKNDVVFLRRHDLIDYSLLVGLVEPPAAPAAPVPLGALATIREVSLHTTAEDFRQPGACPVVPAPEGLPEIYTVGIIDFLSRYRVWKKQTAHFFKSFLWTDAELSTVNSTFYSQRFEAYLDVIFPPSDATVVAPTDAEELKRLGVSATSVAGGAGSLLTAPGGRAVVVLPEGVKSSPAMPRFQRAGVPPSPSVAAAPAAAMSNANPEASPAPSPSAAAAAGQLPPLHGKIPSAQSGAFSTPAAGAQ